MDPSTDPNFPLDLITDQYLDDLWQVRVFSWAGYVILIYDFLLTFSSEVEYIWKSKRSFVKGLFLVNRYGNIIVLATITAQTAGVLYNDALVFCFAFNIVLSILSFLSYASIHILVLLRAWAVWGRQKVMFIILVGSFIVYSGVVISIIILGIVWGGVYAYPTAPIIYTCVGWIPSWAWVLWVPSLVLEAAVFGLMMASLRKHRLGAAYHSSPVVRILIQDAIIYFLITTFANLFNVFIWVVYYDGPKNMLATTFAMCLTSVVGQRLVIDLRMVDPNSAARLNGCIDTLETNVTRSDSPVVFELDALGTVQETIDGGGLKVVHPQTSIMEDRDSSMATHDLNLCLPPQNQRRNIISRSVP